MADPSGPSWVIARRAVWALVERELIRLVRQPARLVVTIGTPALLWLVVGSGLGDRVLLSGEAVEDDLQIGGHAALLPGAILLMVIFGTVFAAIAQLQDRENGLLQAEAVTPAPRWASEIAKVIAGSVSAMVQAAALLILAAGMRVPMSFGGFVIGVMIAGIAAVFIVGLGLLVARRTGSVASFHSIANITLAPMWLLSGALFPVGTADAWLAFFMRINPMHWAGNTLAWALSAGPAAPISLLLLLASSATILTLLIRTSGRPRPQGTM
ncbi:MAG: ABC transporter permease [Planctomycetota bacterium]